MLEEIAKRIEQVPAARLLGLNIIAAERGRATLELPFRKDFCNFHGTIQGGFITALADITGGMALLTLLDMRSRIPTIELKINFLEPARSTLTAEGRVLRKGSTIGISHIDIYDSQGRLAAVSLISYRLVNKEHI